MIYASSIGCCAIEWGNDGKRRAKECRSSIVYRLSEVEKTLKKRRQKRPRGSADLGGEGGRERERPERDDFHGKSKSSTILLELVELPQPRRIHLRVRTDVVASTCLMI